MTPTAPDRSARGRRCACGIGSLFLRFSRKGGRRRWDRGARYGASVPSALAAVSVPVWSCPRAVGARGRPAHARRSRRPDTSRFAGSTSSEWVVELLGRDFSNGVANGPSRPGVHVARGRSVMADLRAPQNVSVITEEITNTTEKLTSAKHPIDTSASKPNFLPVPSDWPICRHRKYFSLPNYFNHTTAEEVEAFLKQWEWLVRDGCYRNSEWFLCLLATPKHPSDPAGNGNRSTAMLPARRHLPCCSFCHHLRDSCWAKLEGSDFPVDCDSLPTEGGCPPCLSVNKQKGFTVPCLRILRARMWPCGTRHPRPPVAVHGAFSDAPCQPSPGAVPLVPRVRFGRRCNFGENARQPHRKHNSRKTAAQRRRHCASDRDIGSLLPFCLLTDKHGGQPPSVGRESQSTGKSLPSSLAQQLSRRWWQKLQQGRWRRAGNMAVERFPLPAGSLGCLGVAKRQRNHSEFRLFSALFPPAEGWRRSCAWGCWCGGWSPGIRVSFALPRPDPAPRGPGARLFLAALPVAFCPCGQLWAPLAGSCFPVLRLPPPEGRTAVLCVISNRHGLFRSVLFVRLCFAATAYAADSFGGFTPLDDLLKVKGKAYNLPHPIRSAWAIHLEIPRCNGQLPARQLAAAVLRGGGDSWLRGRGRGVWGAVSLPRGRLGVLAGRGRDLAFRRNTCVLNIALAAGKTFGSGAECLHRKYFSLPNYFNHTTAEEVEAFLKQWEWLVRDGCYRNSEWFLCLLATPKHPSDPAGNGNRSTAMLPARRHLPCCSFCHHLRDSCWAKLEGSDFPVDCDSLPTEGGCPPCLSHGGQPPSVGRESQSTGKSLPSSLAQQLSRRWWQKLQQGRWRRAGNMAVERFPLPAGSLGCLGVAKRQRNHSEFR
ncbi:hypothetical protein CRUP_033986 [Coryphaenoides rupestris]|nr:hypothetical protein CRUP_033986 [Coryphaenoides rupestris]